MSISLVISQAILLIVSVLLVTLYPNWKHYLNPEQSEDSIFHNNIDGRIFSKEELKNYGAKSRNNIYMGLLGRVYDVSAGRKHYGTDGVYSHFSGLDGTRAFSTGVFTAEGLIDDIRGLTNPQLLDILTWHEFYKNRYPLIGRVVGSYYDLEGHVTDVAMETEKLLSSAMEYRDEEKRLSEKYPACNVHTDGSGTRFWCSDKSGGVERNWVGVPRQFFNPLTHLTSCVCIEDENSLNADIRLYDDCAYNSKECFVK